MVKIAIFFILTIICILNGCEKEKICPQGSIKINNHCEFLKDVDRVLIEIKEIYLNEEMKE